MQGRSSQGYGVGTGGSRREGLPMSVNRADGPRSGHHDWLHHPLAHVFVELHEGEEIVEGLS